MALIVPDFVDTCCWLKTFRQSAWPLLRWESVKDEDDLPRFAHTSFVRFGHASHPRNGIASAPRAIRISDSQLGMNNMVQPQALPKWEIHASFTMSGLAATL